MRHSVGTRLIGSLLLGAAITMLVGGIAMFALVRANNSANAVLDIHMEEMNLSELLTANLAGARRYEKEFFLFSEMSNPAKQEEYRVKLEDAWSALIQNAESLRSLPPGSELREHADELARLVVQSRQELTVVENLMLAGSSYGEVQPQYQEYRSTVHKLEEFTTHMSQHVREILTERQEALIQTQTTLGNLVIATVAVAVVLALLLGMTLTRSITRPISRLSKITKKIAAGDLTQRVQMASRDELGELAASFNQMTEKLQKSTSEIQEKNQELEAMNEELRVSNEELQATGEELREHRDQLEELVQERTAQLITSNEQLTADITERQRTEETLRESEERYRLLFNVSNDAMFVHGITSEGLPRKFIAVNDVACQKLGYTREELLQLSATDITPPEGNAAAPAVIEELFAEKRLLFEAVHIAKDGKRIPAEISSHLFELNGQTTVLSIARDITGRKQAEEREKRLQQELNLASRLASIGEMAAGVAHEINNPLTSVIGFSQLLMSGDIPDDMREDLEVINREAQRVARIVAGLLTFARQRQPEREYVDINDIVLRTVALRCYQMEVNNIQVITGLAPDLSQTMADGNQLQQVFLNIILNAEREMTAAHNGGKLLVKTEKIDGSIRVSFSDDGPGISEKHMDRIFDPSSPPER